MKKHFKNNFIFLSIISFLALPSFVFAQNAATDGLKKVAEKVFNPISDGDASTDLVSILGLIVKTTLSLLGVIFIVLMIYSGYNWMTAAGDDQKVTKAKDTIQKAIIGLIIIASSFSFWAFIQNALLK